MKTKHFRTFLEQIEADFGANSVPLGYSRAVSAIEAQDKKTRALAQKVADYKNKLTDKGVDLNTNLKLESMLAEFEESERTLDEMKTALDTGAVYNSELSKDAPEYIACESTINLADLYNVRHEIPGSAIRFVIENYEDTTLAYTVGEGETIGEHNLTDAVHTYEADGTNKIASILNAPEDVLNDDPLLRDTALYNVQAKYTANAETALLLNTVIKSKEAVEINNDTFSFFTNETLSAYSRRRAEIITNESGFNELDNVNEDGDPYIKKDFQIGEFVYMDRYIVRVLPDEILPNFENGFSPVLVGDWSNVLRLVVILKYPPVDVAPTITDLFNCIVKNKAVERVIPTLTTTSDKAYFVGYFKAFDSETNEDETTPGTGSEDTVSDNTEENNG